jgi:hypothetical protein
MLLPEHDANAIVGEIFSALVIQTTLAAEIDELEQVRAMSVDELDEAHATADEALALAAHEHNLRLNATSKLRTLQAQANAESSATEQLEAQRAQCAAQVRELRELKSKSQRHAAASHSLRVERQQARQQRRTLGAKCVVDVLHRQQTSALLRCFGASADPCFRPVQQRRLPLTCARLVPFPQSPGTASWQRASLMLRS